MCNAVIIWTMAWIGNIKRLSHVAEFHPLHYRMTSENTWGTSEPLFFYLGYLYLGQILSQAIHTVQSVKKHVASISSKSGTRYTITDDKIIKKKMFFLNKFFVFIVEFSMLYIQWTDISKKELKKKKLNIFFKLIFSTLLL